MSSCLTCDDWKGHYTGPHDPSILTIGCPSCGRRFRPYDHLVQPKPDEAELTSKSDSPKAPYGSNRKARRQWAAEQRRSKK